MNLIKSLTITILISCALAASAQADDLETTLKANGWDKIAGTWQEEDGMTLTFGWKFPGKILDLFIKWEESEMYSILYQHPKTGEISVLSTDNVGGHSKGTAVFEADKAVFKVNYVSGDGRTGDKTTEYTLKGDTLEFRVNNGEARSLTRK